MDDVVTGFTKLKLSALSKYKTVGPLINSVTLGPNSIRENITLNASSKIDEHTTAHNKENNESEKRNDTIIKSPSNDDFKYNSPMVTPYKQVLHDFEHKIHENVQNAMSVRKQKILEFNQSQKSSKLQEWKRKQQMQIRQIENQELLILNALNQHDVETDKEQAKLTQHYKLLAERRAQTDRIIKAKQEHLKHMNEMMETIFAMQREFRMVFMEIIQSLKESEDDLREALSVHVNNLKPLTPQMDEFVNKCNSSTVNPQDVQTAKSILKTAKQIRDEINANVLKYKESKKNEQEKLNLKKQKELEKLKQIEEQKQLQQQQQQQQMNINRPNPVQLSLSKSTLKRYAEAQKLIQTHQESYKALMEDPNSKNFRFDCKKAVNIPVNAISAVSPAHLMDKFTKLCNLLSGKTVRLGDNQVTASKHPQGILFCMDLLAKKFVLQGDLMVSSSPEAAFCYASVIMALCNIFPNFTPIIEAHFYKQCPYLVPIYLPKLVDQTDEDYYVSLGYQYNEGAIEKQDKFLKRMSGISRLYFAMLIVKPKRGQNKNVLDIRNAWIWISNLLNTEPQMDITATMLFSFLEVVGSTMENYYNKQFRKIIHLIENHYLPLMKTNDSGGPVVRLEVLLQDYRKDGKFCDPPGIMPDNFW